MESENLPLSRATLDRDARARTEPGLLARLWAEPGTRVLSVRGARVAVRGDVVELTAPVGEPAGVLAYLGRDADGPVVAVLADDRERPLEPGGLDDPEGDERDWRTLRDVGALLPARDVGMATEAIALANWHAVHPCCPRCGARTEVVEAGWVRRCPQDGSQHFPRTDPAVIMAIVNHEGDLLLGHNVAWPEHRYSVPAGFVEPGEPLEAAVRREVAEETGVEVIEVAYAGSQPWPLPASLMVGFTGTTAATAATPDRLEMADAFFCSRPELARRLAAGTILVPQRTSIARALIEDWFGGPLDAE